MTTTLPAMRYPLPNIPRPTRSLTSFINYSKSLEDFFTKYKTRPRDIKFWPYGPYWPQYFENEILESPKLLNTWPLEVEEFQRKKDGEFKTEVNGLFD